ncbi:hypothetical protein X777_05040 [Ooceraea biroi]|uniref:Uncharacterized protein n=1 Tax=Ooceraea biroi TaxID=2015173 RepID=A0A026WF58_OOCBI|nr:hypothetical protein X777_05040 [Ooceraea biroi]
MTVPGAHNGCCQPHKSASARDAEDGGIAPDMSAEKRRSFRIEAGGKRGERGEAGTLDVTAFTLATLFRTVSVDEWYNQRSRGTPMLDDRRGDCCKGE